MALSAYFSRLHARSWLAAMMTGTLVLAFMVGGDYGVSWDESVQSEYAERVWNYFATGGSDTSCNDFLDLRYYGPTADLIAASIYRWAPEKKFEVRHFVTVVFGIFTMLPLYGFGKLLGRPYLGLLAAGLLLLLPRFVGHAFVNSKDIPFACLFAISVWGMTAYFSETPGSRAQWRHALATGVSWGCLGSIRPGGWMLVGVIFTVMLIFTRYLQRQAKRSESIGLQLVTMLGLGWLVMVLPWPWAHENPLLHPITAMRVASHFHLEIPVLFEGETVLSTKLPWYYLFKYLWITVPGFLWCLVIAGLAGATKWQYRHFQSKETRVFFAAQVWLLLPLVLYVITRPNIYDGMRHFLFILPAIAIWSAIGCWQLWQWLQPRWTRAALIALLAFSAAGTGREIIRLHPYQMAYFSPVVGGIAGADGRYETEYWVTSYRAAMEWIAAQPNVRGTIRVLVAANDHSRACAEAFCSPSMDVDIVSSFGHTGPIPAEYDYYVATTRSRMSENFALSPVVHRVGRLGAVFTVVRKQTPTSMTQTPSPGSFTRSQAASSRH